MRSEKHNRKEHKNKEKKEKGMGGFHLFARVWSVLYLLIVIGFLGVLIYTNLLRLKLLCIVAAAVLLILLLTFPALFFKKFKKSRRIIALILSVAVSAACVVGIFYMTGTLDFFSKITNVKT